MRQETHEVLLQTSSSSTTWAVETARGRQVLTSSFLAFGDTEVDFTTTYGNPDAESSFRDGAVAPAPAVPEQQGAYPVARSSQLQHRY